MEYFQGNIVEIKNIYMTHLINIVTPSIYEGIKSVYIHAIKIHDIMVEEGKIDPSSVSPGILKIFQTCLKEIPSLNNNSIENETNRIKNDSKCSDWFDDLIKAVVKSHIKLLIFDGKCKTTIDEELKNYHNKIETKDFVHKCYIEVARLLYNSPELFWHEFPPLEIKRNQKEVYELIKIATGEAIRKILPNKLILQEYLKEKYIDDNDNDISVNIKNSEYMNVKSLVEKDLNKPSDKDIFGGEYSDQYSYDSYDSYDSNNSNNSNSSKLSFDYSDGSIEDKQNDNNNIMQPQEVKITSPKEINIQQESNNNSNNNNTTKPESNNNNNNDITKVEVNDNNEITKPETPVNTVNEDIPTDSNINIDIGELLQKTNKTKGGRKKRTQKEIILGKQLEQELEQKEMMKQLMKSNNN